MTLWYITQRLERNHHGDLIDVLELNYVEYYTKFVGRIQPLPNIYQPLSCDSQFSGLIISGGGDLPNHLLGVDNLSPGDDALAQKKLDVQLKYLDEVFTQGKKVLAVCYGMMLANFYLGGKVTYNVHDEAPSREPRMNHEVSISNGISPSGVSQVLVNTYHRHGITTKDLSRHLVPLAIDEEFGLIEAARHESKNLLCIQWHPERRSPDKEFNRRLLQSFFREDAKGS